MNKVLFIVPPNIPFSDFINPPGNVKTDTRGRRNYGSVITDMPLGVMSLSAYLKKHMDLETRLVDFNVLLNRVKEFSYESFSEFFIDELRKQQAYFPDVVGVSALFTPAFRSLIDIGKVSRSLFPNATILAGGAVPTNMGQEIYQESNCFDGLCYGEGERPLLRVLKANDRKAQLERDRSWITGRKIFGNFELDLIGLEGSLDEIPQFDYSLLDREGYRLNPTIISYTSISPEDKEKSIQVMTTRGCNFHCCFCASHTVHGRKVRAQSLERVREELTGHRNDGIRTIVFQDDHFMADKERAYKVLEMMHELGLNAFFPNSLALYALDRKMLEALKRIGVNQLVLSVESGSERVLKEIMHKPLNLDIVRRVASDSRDLGIYSDVNVLIGLPGETRRDIEDARAFLKTVYANWFRINVATPLVGSEMFDVCRKNGYLKGDILDCNYKRAIVETPDFTLGEIQDMAYLLNLDLNFATNSDMRLGNFETALLGFQNALRVKPDHAFAYHFGAECYSRLGNEPMARSFSQEADKIFRENKSWQEYAKRLGVSI